MSEEFLKKILWTFPEQDVIKTIFNFYEDLQQKVEQLEKELKEANDSISWWSNRFKAVERDNKQLENIIKEAIEYNKELAQLYDIGSMERSNADTNLLILKDEETLNILNKGSNIND